MRLSTSSLALEILPFAHDGKALQLNLDVCGFTFVKRRPNSEAMAKKKENPNNKLVAENRKARYNFAVEDTLEAGIALAGSEVKSLRGGGVNIAESYVSVEEGELWLINGHIPKYKQAQSFGHEERRKRKLLVNKRELSNLYKGVSREGMTIVPLKLYFNDQGRAKLLIGLAKGKKLHDKRDTERERDFNRDKRRLLKQG